VRTRSWHHGTPRRGDCCGVVIVVYLSIVMLQSYTVRTLCIGAARALNLVYGECTDLSATRFHNHLRTHRSACVQHSCGTVKKLSKCNFTSGVGLNKSIVLALPPACTLHRCQFAAPLSVRCTLLVRCTAVESVSGAVVQPQMVSHLPRATANGESPS
jgi:hypothetical protein